MRKKVRKKQEKERERKKSPMPHIVRPPGKWSEVTEAIVQEKKTITTTKVEKKRTVLITNKVIYF